MLGRIVDRYTFRRIRFFGMSSRIMTVVLTVMLYNKLTVKNLLKVSTRVPVHYPMYRHAQGDNTLSGTDYGVS